MEYDFSKEKEIREKWQKAGAYRTGTDYSKPKYYVLDMFPYPSGAGLHVGHPLGYIASDIVARFKRMQGFNVLHPMGYDAFGLPAEQYAIQTGQHPAVTTESNLKQYRAQLDKIGFSFDWDREVKTCDPAYYRWTQWIFTRLFSHWYHAGIQQARPIAELQSVFENEGYNPDDTKYINGSSGTNTQAFSAADWSAMSAMQQELILNDFRLAFLDEAYVNWCPALGCVLANDEVKDGVSERGGFPVERKLMKQWSLRMTCYADRLLSGLDQIHWSESIKEAQRNWIGKSKGASVQFKLDGFEDTIMVFTTRPDTLFGVSFVTLAPEHELVLKITTGAQRAEVEQYIQVAKNRSERERQADVKRITGCFTGAYVWHPITGAKIPVWVGDYVLAGYGTGAVMAVPAHDTRDWAFANHFGLPKPEVVTGGDIAVEAFDSKEGFLINSDFLNGLQVPAAIDRMIEELEQRGLGKGKINYRLRDAVFGRQRYWGEPIPIYYENGIPRVLPDERLPLELPHIDKYLPTETGEPPLARASSWQHDGHPLETTTMPGWAGSSWYFLRYMDPGNQTGVASVEALKYWNQIDLYMGGSEHATGHLLYFRFWTKFLYDLGMIAFEEPAKKLVNQGMIQGMSAFIYRDAQDRNLFHSNYEEGRSEVHVDVNLLEGDDLIIEALRGWRADLKDAHFAGGLNRISCKRVVEKMSKSKYNVVNPDLVIEKFGADTLRLFEMFLGPLELSKPWNTQGIEGVHRFLKKLWKLFYNEQGALLIQDAPATPAELKIIHRTIKKITEDIEHLSLNTSVSAFMICVNELGDLQCHKREVLHTLLKLLCPFAPHICENLWEQSLGEGLAVAAEWPIFDPAVLVENSFIYPVSVNGKHRNNLEFPLDLDPSSIEKAVLSDEVVQKWMEGKPLKKLVFVKGKIINIVV